MSYQQKHAGLIYKHYDHVVKAVDPAAREVHMVLTALALDRDSEVIDPAGVDFSAFMQHNGPTLWNHDPDEPIANVRKVFRSGERLEGIVKFYPKGMRPKADEIAELYLGGFLATGSIGFLPVEVDDRPILSGQRGRTFKRIELLEFSLTPVPSLREAVAVRHWRPSGARDVRGEFLDTLAVIQGMIRDFHYERASLEIDRAIVLTEIISIEEELSGGGWR